MLITSLIHQLNNVDDVIFDLDNTLFNQEDYDFGAFEEIEKKLIVISRLPLYGIAHFLLRHKQNKGANYPYLFNDALTTYKLPQHYLSIMLETYYQHNGRYISQEKSLIPDLLTVFKTKRTFIVTNGPIMVQQTKIDKLKLNNYSCDIVICDSKSPHHLKPNSYAFDLLKKRHHLTSVTMVGDTIETDGLFAKNAQIPFIHFSYVDYCHENT